MEAGCTPRGREVYSAKTREDFDTEVAAKKVEKVAAKKKEEDDAAEKAAATAVKAADIAVKNKSAASHNDREYT